jgi:hypothetical protein
LGRAGAGRPPVAGLYKLTDDEVNYMVRRIGHGNADQRGLKEVPSVFQLGCLVLVIGFILFMLPNIMRTNFDAPAIGIVVGAVALGILLLGVAMKG